MAVFHEKTTTFNWKHCIWSWLSSVNFLPSHRAEPRQPGSVTEPRTSRDSFTSNFHQIHYHKDCPTTHDDYEGYSSTSNAKYALLNYTTQMLQDFLWSYWIAKCSFDVQLFGMFMSSKNIFPRNILRKSFSFFQNLSKFKVSSKFTMGVPRAPTIPPCAHPCGTATAIQRNKCLLTRYFHFVNFWPKIDRFYKLSLNPL